MTTDHEKRQIAEAIALLALVHDPATSDAGHGPAADAWIKGCQIELRHDDY
jgi:hypothetical protein